MSTDIPPPKDSAIAADLLSNAWARTFIAETTVPLFVVQDDGKLVHLGSGVLFEARGRYFVVTAQHILEGRNPTTICIPKRNGEERLRTIGKCHVSYPQDATLDVAVIELQIDETVSVLRQNARFVTTRHMGLMDLKASAYLCGYPSELMKMKGAKLEQAKQFMVRTYFREWVTPNLKDPPIQGVEMFLNYDRTGLSESGAPMATPELEGMSGCGVWQAIRRNEGIWTSDSDLRLIGVQHAYKHVEFCRAISWSIVYECFKSFAPDIAQDIFDAVFPPGTKGPDG